MPTGEVRSRRQPGQRRPRSTSDWTRTLDSDPLHAVRRMAQSLGRNALSHKIVGILQPATSTKASGILAYERLTSTLYASVLQRENPSLVLLGAAQRNDYRQELVIQKARLVPTCSTRRLSPLYHSSRHEPTSVGPPTPPPLFTLLHNDDFIVILSTAARTSVDVFYFNVIAIRSAFGR
ncbi:hypothetical protein GALMADRAFT_149003 [Galerina marginata CBS 339.88]|uniref:Uncharacterized protein n=1 Tax=Galerina marginata (strain CBS 339.88) TaxID=685588 RepID=A0A067SBF1_GALM3|nr:hypothetical protein GALMADRAFT_149003 [Galerina marginata CBS 339.88]